MAHSQLYIRIMNSARWRNEVRPAKLAQNPLCEECLKKEPQMFTPAQCVHHLTEIESAKTDKEAWDLATSFNNLQSLCFEHHRKAHAEKRSHSKEAHKQRNSERLERFKARHFNQ